MNALEIVRLLDAIVNLAARAGINLARYQEMRTQGDLTPDQIQELADEAHQSVGDM